VLAEHLRAEVELLGRLVDGAAACRRRASRSHPGDEGVSFWYVDPRVVERLISE